MLDYRNSLNIECPRAKGAYLEEVPQKVWESPDEYWTEPKEDGDRATLQLGAHQSLLIGRNRQDKQKGVAVAGQFRHMDCNPYLERITNLLHKGTILDGEVTEQYNSDGTMSKDTKRRLDNGDFVGFTVWTCLMFDDMDVRHEDEVRRRELAALVVQSIANPRVRLIDTLPCTRESLQTYFDRGLEGGIIKWRHGTIPRNQRTMPTWWKAKGAQYMTVDAFVTGVTEGSSGGSGVNGVKRQKDGTAASFTVSMLDGQGRPVEVAKVKHLPEAMHRDGLRFFDVYRHMVLEFQVSGWDGQAFRWPKFVRVRTDKTPADCLLSEQLGSK